MTVRANRKEGISNAGASSTRELKNFEKIKRRSTSPTSERHNPSRVRMDYDGNSFTGEVNHGFEIENSSSELNHEFDK